MVGNEEANNERVDKEAKRFSDILRGNVSDTYVQNELHAVKTPVERPQYAMSGRPQYAMPSTF